MISFDRLMNRTEINIEMFNWVINISVVIWHPKKLFDYSDFYRWILRAYRQHPQIEINYLDDIPF